jgi:hypothetical protein
MIFDSESMSRLRAQYASEPDYAVPKIVCLDRSDILASEREHLEELAQSAPQHVQKGWVGRLLSTDPAQHIGAWFEIMLYGWLLEIGPVVPEPLTEGTRPDFSVRIAEQEIYIEARALLVDADYRERERRLSEIREALQQIKLPFIVTIRRFKAGESTDSQRIADEAAKWLSDMAQVPFHYEDELGNKALLTADPQRTLRGVSVARIDTGWPNPESLKTPLKEKAKRHKSVRRAGYPYVLAFFLESPWLSAEDVAEAWFGGTSVTIDVETSQVLHVGPDRSGLHFFGSELRHRTVSGTLVFRADLNKEIGRHELKPWYIQNPFAKRQIEPGLFPAESRFILLDEKQDNFSMAWKWDSLEEGPLSRRSD